MSSPPVVEERDQLQEQILRKRKISNTADLIRKGGSLLQEVCPKCGNLQIKYKERVYCVACDEMELVSYSGDIAKAPGLVGVAKQIRGSSNQKCRNYANPASRDSRWEKQSKLSLVRRICFEMLFEKNL